jgi:hypothetical protein
MAKWQTIAQIASIIVANTMLASSVNAAESTDWGTVLRLQAGWTIDRMLVFHSKPTINPANPVARKGAPKGMCSLTTDGYIIDENAPGHNLFNTLVLSALLNGREVQFVIDGCKENRPQIVSVSIR